jgi:hypothetical protein
MCSRVSSWRQLRTPAGDVGRSERRVAAAQVAAVVREQAQRERLALLGEADDHRAQRRQVGGVADGAAQLARRPAHRDILRLDVGPARIEEAPLGIVEREREARKGEHLAGLDDVLDAARRAVVAPRAVLVAAHDVDGGGGVGRHRLGRSSARGASAHA